MSGQTKAKAIKAAMNCIPMSREGPAYRQRLEDFRHGYMAGHAGHTRWANKKIFSERERIADLEQALCGLRDLCEQAGMPCDRANRLLSHKKTRAQADGRQNGHRIMSNRRHNPDGSPSDHDNCTNLTWRELVLLADWHDMQAVEADAIDFSECVPYHEQRAKAFREFSEKLKSSRKTGLRSNTPPTPAIESAGKP